MRTKLFISYVLVPYIYNHKLQLHLYQTISHKWVNLGITPFLPLRKKEIYTMERNLQVIFIILAFCQTIKMDIEPCANSMWMEGVIRDCYAGQAERIEGLAHLSLQMTLEKPYVLASYCQCQPANLSNWICGKIWWPTYYQVWLF